MYYVICLYSLHVRVRIIDILQNHETYMLEEDYHGCVEYICR